MIIFSLLWSGSPGQAGLDGARAIDSQSFWRNKQVISFISFMKGKQMCMPNEYKVEDKSDGKAYG
jgi:hypothetical protein